MDNNSMKQVSGRKWSEPFLYVLYDYYTAAVMLYDLDIVAAEAVQ